MILLSCKQNNYGEIDGNHSVGSMTEIALSLADWVMADGTVVTVAGSHFNAFVYAAVDVADWDGFLIRLRPIHSPQRWVLFIDYFWLYNCFFIIIIIITIIFTRLWSTWFNDGGIVKIES